MEVRDCPITISAGGDDMPWAVSRPRLSGRQHPADCPYPANTAEAALWMRREHSKWALANSHQFVAMAQRGIEDAMAKKAEAEKRVTDCESEIAALTAALEKLKAQ